MNAHFAMLNSIFYSILMQFLVSNSLLRMNMIIGEEILTWMNVRINISTTERRSKVETSNWNNRNRKAMER